MMTKLCFITQNLMTVGGVQTVVKRFVNYFAEDSDYSVDIIMPYSNKIDDLRALPSSVKVHNLDTVFGTILKGQGIIERCLWALNRRTGLLNNHIFTALLQRIALPREKKNQISSFLNEKKYDAIVGVGDNYAI